jgi:hypothetical protein
MEMSTLEDAPVATISLRTVNHLPGRTRFRLVDDRLEIVDTASGVWHVVDRELPISLPSDAALMPVEPYHVPELVGERLYVRLDSVANALVYAAEFGMKIATTDGHYTVARV